MNILDGINGVDDLKKLSNQDLEKLAGEIRHFLIEVVAKNGGHLAPSLGVIEITLALHQVYNSPSDKIIWDVGHQSYAHKIITGRKNIFSTLRCYKGLSGFPKRTESEHDCFNTGHSSTSISAAIGMAIARDRKEENYNVIAVIGDGALSGGMAFEALNHAGALKTDLTVILNDNKMSIAANVGAMAGYLSRMRTDPRYEKGKDEIENLLSKIPKLGSKVLRTAERLKDSLKYLVVPGMFFEEMGFTYLGPIDGHNITAIKSVLTNAQMLKGPVFIHMITQKGRGYLPAEKNPDQFHGVGPFDIQSGKSIKPNGPPTFTEVFGNTLVSLAKEHEEIVAITAAMPGGTGLNSFAQEFPARFFDVGIAEQHGVTFAAGLASQGFHPVVAIYSTFLQRAYDQILHDVCLQKLPVIFAVDRAGLVGEDGETHQGVFDISFLRHIPNLVIMAPKDERELQNMLKTAINIPGPCAIRYPRGTGIGVSLQNDLEKIPIGQSELTRDGKDMVIIAVGPMVYLALETARLLESYKIDAAVINARFIKPLDADLILECALNTGRVVTLEEHVLPGGFGSACLELFNRYGSRIEVETIALPDSFIEQGSADFLRQQYGLTSSGVAEKIMSRWTFGSKPRAFRGIRK